VLNGTNYLTVTIDKLNHSISCVTSESKLATLFMTFNEYLKLLSHTQFTAAQSNKRFWYPLV